MCKRAIKPAECTNHRPWIIPGMLYGLMFEHGCGTSRTIILWEIPDDVLALDGELSGRDSLSDLRPTETAA